MNILVVGSGGREHALAWKIKQSPLCTHLYVAPGNAGTAAVAENLGVAADDFDGLAALCLNKAIDLVVVGPEVPLANGIRDYFESRDDVKHIALVGPGKAGARLESSKDFSKQFMLRHGITTAAAHTFEAHQVQQAVACIDGSPLPLVVKADGLAAGKGVIICHTHEKARQTVREILLDGKFGEAGARVLIEEFLEGIELSVFVLTDGKNYVLLPEAKDYKRIGEGDTGPNTGGMGAVSPVAFADAEFMARVEQKIIKPTIAGLAAESIPYRGFIFIGLMNVKGEPYVIEYNVRLGDPETQAVLPRIDADLAAWLWAAANGTLKSAPLPLHEETTVTVVMVAEGYPGSYAQGRPIGGLEKATGALVFHAGTAAGAQNILTAGGRVMAVTGSGKTIDAASKAAYQAISAIHWEGLYFRKDIGIDLQHWAAAQSTNK